jgi:serine/threonine-protein kinase
VQAAVAAMTLLWAGCGEMFRPASLAAITHVVALIQRCLEKDRNARIGDMAVARFLLAGHATLASPPSAATMIATAAKPAPAPAAASPKWRQALPFVVVATLAGVVVGGAASWLLPRGAIIARGPTHLQMSIAPADSLVGSFASLRPSRTAFAIAPDGRSIVFSGVRNGVLQLYVRGLDRAEATPIPGTEHGVAPFFSPDGAWIGFSGDNKIRKIPAAGGPVETICDAASPNGVSASWGDGGTIVFATRDGLSTVSASGGAPKVLGKPGSATAERLLTPQLLPGGKEVLVTAMKMADDTTSVVLQPIDGGDRRVLVEGGSDARYIGTGHLVYMKSGTLMAAPFDLRSRQATGAPVALIERVMHAINASNGNDDTAAAQFAVSAAGTLAYVDGGAFTPVQDAFTWVDRAGATRALDATPTGSYLGPRLSPDSRKIAVSVRRSSPRGTDLWVYDVARGAPTRLTFSGRNSMAVWAPDGRRLAFAGNGSTGRDGLFVIDADGGGEHAILPAGESGLSMSWSTTDVLVFLRRMPDGRSAIWTIAAAGSPQPGPARTFLESRFSLQFPVISPDGRWMAYASNESGEFEIYVQPYPGPGGKTRVSTAGGREPLWSPDSRELLYRTLSMSTGKQSVYSAAIGSAPPLRVDVPRLLFDATESYDLTSPERGWDISSDGRRFLLMRQVPSNDKPVTTMHVVLDWTQQLPRLVPAK